MSDKGFISDVAKVRAAIVAAKAKVDGISGVQSWLPVGTIPEFPTFDPPGAPTFTEWQFPEDGAPFMMDGKQVCTGPKVTLGIPGDVWQGTGELYAIWLWNEISADLATWVEETTAYWEAKKAHDVPENSVNNETFSSELALAVLELIAAIDTFNEEVRRWRQGWF